MTPRDSTLSIWNAGIDAVRAESLVAANVRLHTDRLSICDVDYALAGVGRICVVGAGKAAGFLAAGMEEVLRPIAGEHQLHGWINVPSNCLLPTEFIRLHASRPAAVNEPRGEGEVGAKQILRIVSSLETNDLCLCLLTGGGSALLPAPAAGVSLADKLLVTRLLSANGASIQQLNRVRIAMSEIKGGGLRRVCGAQKLVTLIVSDIIGDPLELIASGPTIDLASGGPSPLEILSEFATEADLPSSVWEFFRRLASQPKTPLTRSGEVDHHLLANNATAVRAAADAAAKRGFAVQTLAAESPTTSAEEVATQFVDRLRHLDTSGPHCLIWGGEPVVRLVAEDVRGQGGRNQQLALAALSQWPRLPREISTRLCILSAGSDGEDGPTDAAGAFVDQEVVLAAEGLGLDARSYLQRNDAYTFFDSLNALHRTGPTHTNVCDLRVAVLQ